MELNQLEALLTVAETQNITKAAEQLHITQSALSKSIMRLESDLGLKLFDRNGKKITVNENGLEMCNYARSAMRIVGDMAAVADARKSERIGVLNIGSSYPPTETDFIGTSLFRFYLEYPDVKIIFKNIPLSGLKEALQNKEIDLAITTLPISGDGIYFDELFNEPIGVVLSKEHPLAKYKTLALRDLKNERFLAYETLEGEQNMTRALCTLAGFEPTICVKSDHSLFITHAVSRSSGVALITKQEHLLNVVLAQSQSWIGDVAYRPIRDPFCRRVCGLSFLEGLYYPSYSIRFREIIHEEVHKIAGDSIGFPHELEV